MAAEITAKTLDFYNAQTVCVSYAIVSWHILYSEVTLSKSVKLVDAEGKNATFISSIGDEALFESDEACKFRVWYSFQTRNVQPDTTIARFRLGKDGLHKLQLRIAAWRVFFRVNKIPQRLYISISQYVTAVL